MTLPDERYRAVVQTEQFLLSLLTMPRIPKEVRQSARILLRHYPTKYIMEKTAELYPAGFQKDIEPVTRMMMSYDIEQKEKKNESNV